MSRAFRVLDAGLRDGRFNIALDQAMLELRQAGEIGDSLRFIHFRPSALIGRHQALSAELDLDYCRRHGIQAGRRITGGGAIYLDPGQLGWALVFERSTLGNAPLAEVARMVCEAAALGLSRLGVEARFRPRNDIEVEGRKIGGTGGFFEGDTLLYQGTVLVELDTTAMLGALRVPKAKVARHGLDCAAQRVVSLRELLGRCPAMEAVQQALLEGFQERLAMQFQSAPVTEVESLVRRGEALHEAQLGRDEFVAEIDGEPGEGVSVGTHASPGGTITMHVRREGRGGRRIGQVLITGDFFVAPPRLVLDLESRLRGIEVQEAGEQIERFFLERPGATLSVSGADFRRSLDAALGVAAVPGTP